MGDPITVELRYQELQNGRAVSAAMDDKTGLWVVIEALRRVDRSKLQVAAYSVSTVQEEIGLRGADQFLQRRSARGNRRGRDSRHRLPDHRKKGRGRYPPGCRAGRVSRAEHEPQGCPTAPRRRPKVRDSLPVGASGRATPTDANSIQVNRAGVAAALISIPNRYMHSPVEMVSLDDLDHAANLLARFLEDLPGDAEFIP